MNAKTKRMAITGGMVDRVMLRRAIANYIGSEGCSCCRGRDHEEHKAVIARLLKVRRYKDDSGWNFGHYKSNP